MEKKKFWPPVSSALFACKVLFFLNYSDANAKFEKKNLKKKSHLSIGLK